MLTTQCKRILLAKQLLGLITKKSLVIIYQIIVIFANFIQLEIWKSVCCIGPVQNVFIFGEFAQQRSESAELWSRPENSIFHRTPEIWISSAGKSMNFKLSQKTPTKLKVNWSWGSKFCGNSWGSFNQALIFLSCFSSFNKLPSTRLSVVD